MKRRDHLVCTQHRREEGSYEMKKYGNFASTFFALLLVLLLYPQNAAAQTETFCLSGTGSLLLSPPGWEGFIDCGTLNGGYFTIHVDDTGWPVDNPGTPQNERWNYIVANFFTYVSEPLNEHWVGYLPMQGTPAPPVVFRFYNNGDKLGGVMFLNFTIVDKDKDGVMDAEDLMTQAFAANIRPHVEQGTGRFEGKCGVGSMNGTIEDFDPTPIDIFTVPYGTINLRTVGCTLPAEHSTWGMVKTLYAE
jgi:hypothetical protein